MKFNWIKGGEKREKVIQGGKEVRRKFHSRQIENCPETKIFKNEWVEWRSIISHLYEQTLFYSIRSVRMRERR